MFNKVYIFSHDHHGHYLLSYRMFKDHPIIGTGVKGLGTYVEIKYIYWKKMMDVQLILIIRMFKYWSPLVCLALLY